MKKRSVWERIADAYDRSGGLWLPPEDVDTLFLAIAKWNRRAIAEESEPSTIAIMAAARIMNNTEAASKACNGPRFHFIEYRDEQAREVQRAIDETLATLRPSPVDAGERKERCEYCGELVSDWVNPDWSVGRICRPCEAIHDPEKPAPVATAGVSDGELLDWLANERAMIVLKDGTEDVDCIFGDLCEPENLRPILRAAMTAANQPESKV